MVDTSHGSMDEVEDDELAAALEASRAWARDELERLAQELGLRQRVLIVEDEPDSADLLGYFLERRGHSCRVARSLAEALEAVGELEPDVVLLDLVLPDGEGWEVVPRLRANGRSPRIVALTGWTDRASRERAEREGLDGYYLKPAELRQVLRIVEGE